MGKEQETITLNTMEDVVSYLSDNVNKVSYDVSNINSQFDEVQNKVNNMQNNVASLETEIRTFMKEMKQNAVINNAKQSIMLLQMEYEKKYQHRDEVRRRTLGLLQSIDINLIKKETIETISEEAIVSNPDYWLAPALVAICHWYGNNQKLAELALKKALDRSVEKTSLLFFLIHLRANRYKTAALWLNKYLKLQDPTNMDCKIVLLLDALCSGIFNQEIVDLMLNQIDKWKIILNNYPEYKTNQIPKWEDYFKKQQTVTTQSKYQFINLFVKEKNEINEVITFSNNHNQVIKRFKENLSHIEQMENNKQHKIDKIINMLIFDYEQEELELKLEIEKNNQIINEKTEKTINKNDYDYLKTDLYTHISNMCITDNKFDISKNTKKFAICLSKEPIIEAYQKAYSVENEYELRYLDIIIEDWVGITQNGSNEFELKDRLQLFIQEKYQKSLNKTKILSLDIIILTIITMIFAIVFRKTILVIIILLIALLGYSGYRLYQNYKKNKLIKNLMQTDHNNKKELLICTIAEIVDYYFISEESKKTKEEFIKYLETLNYSEYIKVYRENNRNIMIGGTNGK